MLISKLLWKFIKVIFSFQKYKNVCARLKDLIPFRKLATFLSTKKELAEAHAYVRTKVDDPPFHFHSVEAPTSFGNYKVCRENTKMQKVKYVDSENGDLIS